MILLFFRGFQWKSMSPLDLASNFTWDSVPPSNFPNFNYGRSLYEPLNFKNFYKKLHSFKFKFFFNQGIIFYTYFIIQYYALNYWIEKGANSRKIVMGMPMYGQGFTLANVSDHGLNAPAAGPSHAGEYTRSAGFLAYYEVSPLINDLDFRHYFVR